MKKIFFTIALTVGLALGAAAQSDNLFNDWSDFDNRDGGMDMPSLPGEHGLTGNQSAPLGSGLLILTALGAGYAATKKSRE